MAKKNYLNIEEKIFKIGGKYTYTFAFTILFLLFMLIINFLLFCFIDNYYTFKFVFSKEIKFSDFIKMQWDFYKFPYFKMVVFTIILLCIAIYRSKTLKKYFTKKNN